ncbi:MAG TPA: oxidoreductase [Rhabdaerophilum sp.]|nr:oxidoreductase [Rhabdaerophilum sp.]
MYQLVASAFALIVLGAAPSTANDRAAEKVILRIEGILREGHAKEFTRSHLEALGLTTIRTTTPWHDGVQQFEGIRLDVLMKTVGAEGKTAHIVALNKYRTEIPVSDFARFGPILALKRNGQYMEVRDKGPLFVIYPFDNLPELKSELYYSRSAWQVRAMTLE